MSNERLQEIYEDLGGEEAAKEALLELADDEEDKEARAEMCRRYAEALAQTGKFLWLHGALIGPDRAEGQSPFGFGNDDVVGLATVCQIGGELTRGAIDLIEADNRYGAAALVRQLLEIEYLSFAFAEKDEIAAEWLHADRDRRKRFWSPGELRKRSGGRYLSADYWDHCDRGGHPTRDAFPLLPDHKQMHPAFFWADLAGHLYSVWSNVVRAVEVRGDELSAEVRTAFPSIAEATECWLEQDKLTLVLRAMHAQVRRPADQAERGGASSQ
jgi:hypothetical protein